MKPIKPPRKIDDVSRGKPTDNLLDLNRQLQGYSYHPVTPPGAPIANRNPKQPRSFSWKKLLLRVSLGILFVALLAGLWLGWKLLHNELKVFGWKGIVSLIHPTKLKGESSGRVTILLAGNSADDPGHSGANLTDSIMIASLDTTNHRAFMMSIPRDLYVTIPNHGYAKINEVYQDGEEDKFSQAGYASGGMGLLEQVIHDNFGLTINYYALVNYAAVRQAVDAVGGISVTIASNDSRGLYDPSPDLSNHYLPLVKLSNGVHVLNGTQALGLARARGDSYYSYGYALSDFTRTQNQRLILLALKDKVTSLSTLANPLKLGELFDSIGGNVKTDLTLGEIKRAYQLIKLVPDSSITSAGLNDVNGTNLLKSYTNKYGQSTLIPAAGLDDYSAIKAYIIQLSTPPPKPSGQ